MNRKTNLRMLIALSFLCMFIFGFVESLRGTAIPPIREDFGVDYSSIGIMLLISSLGYLTACFGGGFLAGRLGQKKILLIGFSLLAIGCAALILAESFAATAVLFFLINAGFGCFEVGVNSLAAQIYVRNTAIMMNLMHLFYGLAASMGPKYAGILLTNNISWKYIYVFSLIPVVLSIVYLISTRFPEDSHEEHSSTLPLQEIVKNKKVWLFIGVCGFGQVAELGAGNWTVNFLQEARGMDVDQSSMYMTMFFIAFTIGRLVGGYLAEKFGYAKMIFCFACLNIILLTAGVSLDNKFAFLFSLMGFSVSILFPTVMSMVMKEFTAGRSSIIGFIITGSGCVNMISNWIIGKTNDFFGVSIGFASLAVYAGMILVCIGLLSPLLGYRKVAQQTA